MLMFMSVIKASYLLISHFTGHGWLREIQRKAKNHLDVMSPMLYLKTSVSNKPDSSSFLLKLKI